jgi:NADH:ubiquinone oxidoreductase subunit H
MILLSILLTIISVLIAIAFYTLAERKILASIQRRKGPSLVGFGGSLQAFADGLKLFLKEIIIPIKANSWLYIASPLLTLTVALTV